MAWRQARDIGWRGRGGAPVSARADGANPVGPDLDAIADRLLARFESPAYQPPALPAAVRALVALVRRPDATLEESVALIERDAYVAAHVQTLAEREGMAAGVKVTSLRQAILFLGLVQVHDRVIDHALETCVFRCGAYAPEMGRLRRHAVATAHLARSLAEWAPIEGGLAFVAGLLHDVGIAGSLRLLAEGDGRLVPPPDVESIWPALERIHARATALMTRRWGLPEELALAVAGHDACRDADAARPLAAAVAIANALAHHEGFGLAEREDASVAEPPGRVRSDSGGKDGLAAFDRTPEPVLERACAILGLDLRARHLVAHRARRELEQLAEST
ncbi:MAG: HDOD domain-containing protein [Myxococcota bacterium]